MPSRPRALAPLLIFTLAGCSSDPAPKADAKGASDAPAPDASANTSTDRLTLGAAKIMRAGHEDRAIVITPEGTVTMAGLPFGKVSSDGSLRDAEGAPMMRVQPDGVVVAEGGESTGITLTEGGGKLTLPRLSVAVRFNADGTITTDASGPNAQLLGVDAPQMLSEGCEGPVIETCALLTLSYLMALGNPDSGKEADAQ